MSVLLSFFVFVFILWDKLQGVSVKGRLGCLCQPLAPRQHVLNEALSPLFQQEMKHFGTITFFTMGGEKKICALTCFRHVLQLAANAPQLWGAKRSLPPRYCTRDFAAGTG